MSPNANAIHARTSRPPRDQQVVGADVDDAERDERLDDAGRRSDQVQRRQRQRDAVREREARDHAAPAGGSCRRAAAGRPGTAGGPGRSGCGGCRRRTKRRTTASMPCARSRRSTRACVRSRSRIACCRSADRFVDVDERLMLRVVREQRRRTASDAGRAAVRLAVNCSRSDCRSREHLERPPTRLTRGSPSAR